MADAAWKRNPPTHRHVWDTETEEFSTFTPDPQLDTPWVIHECIEVGCLAIKVTRVLRDRPVEIVYEEDDLPHPTYTVICPCGFYAMCWSPTGGGRIDTCPACERPTAQYGAFTYLEGTVDATA